MPPSVAERIATPEGKRRYVRALFATIAGRYDFITVALSYGQDRRWKRRLIRIAAPGPGSRVLDLATGTGDIAFAAAARGAEVVGVDITLGMIELAKLKAARGFQASGSRDVSDDVGGRSPERLALRFIVGDMLALPFPAASFDIVTTGYGLRNVPDLTSAIDEIRRVLKPGGRLVSLDFNRPANAVVRNAYFGYLSVVGGALGWA
jgi:demethylmenaquinone methyltransferase/2-methoxy-6-polyprenyl-1,4-benzoquinol methylase